MALCGRLSRDPRTKLEVVRVANWLTGLTAPSVERRWHPSSGNLKAWCKVSTAKPPHLANRSQVLLRPQLLLGPLEQYRIEASFNIRHYAGTHLEMRGCMTPETIMKHGAVEVMASFCFASGTGLMASACWVSPLLHQSETN